jgi:hypothetical protein
VTAAWIEEVCYGLFGLSRRATDTISMSEFYARLRGYDRAERPKWERAFAVANAFDGAGRSFEKAFGRSGRRRRGGRMPPERREALREVLRDYTSDTRPDR